MNGSILFLIPARGGSRRVPGKNLRPVGGIPLVGRAVRIGRVAAAALPGASHRVVCSTDHPDIAAAATAWGAEVLERPPELATAEASSVDVALHALGALGDRGPIETLVLIQPTSPLTDPRDLVAAINRHRAAGGAGVVSVTRSHPTSWRLAVAADGTLGPVRPEADGSQLLSGAFYVISPEALRRDHRFVEPGRTLGQTIAPDRSVDIDDAMDLVVAEALLAARPVRTVPLGDRRIGERTFVIAEAGVNHDGSIELAHRLVDAAADVGADAVKFQTFEPKALAAMDAPTAAYQSLGDDTITNQLELLGRLALPADAWAGLQAHAVDRGIVFLSTPFDDGSAALLDALEVPAFKVGSGELTNLPFLARLARLGRPMLISTGMADMREVAAAVDAVAAAGDPPIALLHCVSSYPAAPSDANLAAMETMRRAFGVPVGWSDHTLGVETALAAVALGAALVEKHLTMDRTMRGPDHHASLDPSGFTAMVSGIRTVSASLGSGDKAPVAAEADVAAVARRSLHWRRELEAGVVIRADDLDVLRPASGLAPSHAEMIVGRRTTRSVRTGKAVRAADVEGRS